MFEKSIKLCMYSLHDTGEHYLLSICCSPHDSHIFLTDEYYKLVGMDNDDQNW